MALMPGRKNTVKELSDIVIAILAIIGLAHSIEAFCNRFEFRDYLAFIRSIKSKSDNK